MCMYLLLSMGEPEFVRLRIGTLLFNSKGEQSRVRPKIYQFR